MAKGNSPSVCFVFSASGFSPIRIRVKRPKCRYGSRNSPSLALVAPRRRPWRTPISSRPRRRLSRDLVARKALHWAATVERLRLHRRLRRLSRGLAAPRARRCRLSRSSPHRPTSQPRSRRQRRFCVCAKSVSLVSVLIALETHPLEYVIKNKESLDKTQLHNYLSGMILTGLFS